MEWHENYAIPKDTKQFHAVPYDAMQYNGKHKNQIFVFFWGQKRTLAAPLELAEQHEQHENVVF